MATTCGTCGTENRDLARFCDGCGSPLERTEPGGEERKLVSVLFVDLVGFTSSADKRDPEEVRDSLRPYHEWVKGVVEELGGTVEKFIGDAVMAVFGARVSHGDDAERAIRAGLLSLAGLEDVNRAHALSLRARAAVETGVAVVASGPHRPGEPLATGDVVNTASRLQSAAPVGRVIVGEEAWRAARHAFTFEDMYALMARGKADPLHARLAIEPVVQPAERPIAGNPLVGRSREIDLFRAAWNAARDDRRPHLVTIVGPPGIGKSRLCQEVTAIVGGDGGRVVRGRCLPYGEQAGYEAFAAIVRDVCGIYHSDAAEVGRAKLERVIGGLASGEDADELARHLSMLVGFGGDTPVDDPALLRYGARRFLESMGQRQPLLVVFEDIHWAHASELELIEYLASHLRDSSVTLVALTRPELLDTRRWGSGLVSHTVVPLEPLGANDAALLAGHLLHGASHEERDRIVALAEGNPLFLEELAAALTELGDAAELPVTVRAAIAARIDVLAARREDDPPRCRCDREGVLVPGALGGHRRRRPRLGAGAAGDARLRPSRRAE